MRRIAILGYGLEGKSLLSYFRKDRDAEITVLDRDKTLKIPSGVKQVLGRNYLKGLSKFDVIFRSPGVPYNLLEIQRVKKNVSSLTRLFFEKALEKKAKIIGVTGSVGKTTTDTLLYKILKNVEKDVFLAGNIGINALSHLKKMNSRSIIVMELSSFQLQDLDISPNVAVVLDIFEEHLDRHKNFREYLEAKGNITRHQRKSDAVVYFSDNIFSRKIARLSPGRKIPVSSAKAERERFRLRMPGKYNLKNALAAKKTALLFAAPVKVIRSVIENFSGIEHRLEFVRNFKGVLYYNNSKATNVGSAVGGVDTFAEKKIVLAGGYNKNLNLLPLVRRLSRPDVRSAVFFGKCRGQLVRLSKKIKFSDFILSKNLTRAVRSAGRLAQRGDVVLLSPGTASFDEFKNYEERGRKFKDLVRKLK